MHNGDVLSVSYIEQRRTLATIQLIANDPATLANLVAYRAMYNDRRGQPVIGTASAVDRIDRAAVTSFYERAARPNGAILVIGGDITSATAFDLATQRFGAWPRSAVSPANEPVSAVPASGQVIVVDQPAAGRTAIVVAKPTIGLSSADVYASLATTSVIGGFSGRLNNEIRVKRGLSYGAAARQVIQGPQSPFIASTLVEHAKAPEAEALMLATVRELARTPVETSELTSSELAYVGTYGRSIETETARARADRSLSTAYDRSEGADRRFRRRARRTSTNREDSAHWRIKRRRFGAGARTSGRKHRFGSKSIQRRRPLVRVRADRM